MQSPETGITGMGPSVSISVPPEKPSASDSHPTPSAAPIYTLPDKVWHKSDNLSENQREWTGSWTNKNPSLRQELLTDRSTEAFVRAHYFKTRPDIVEVYEALSIAILRADLFRYLVVLAEGGIWGDLDTTCEKEVSEWVPLEYRNENIDMIVGLEFDFEWRGPGTEVASQFCNWVFVGRKNSRNLQVIVDTVINQLKDIARANAVGIEGITWEMLPDVVNVTGPKIMTIAIMQSLEQLLGRPVDDRDYAHITRPKLVGDVLIMPGVSFAALQNKNPTDQGDPLVTHHYEGLWKKEQVQAKERKKQKEEQERQQQGSSSSSSSPSPASA
ncbi:hypothetical protein E8E15_008022 [Penicillium rubens]|jgi:mannosyltransferase OCH1-like enzyme|uniref:uncharacterized protein n=1 Tax=Penicillium rubens TaxID=1108849 RepID=UPI001D58811A|nr:uncharacterized protein N7525_004485 [Penicillium rubens]KAF3029317.1 hypothetical protein E8E15_008022 [Penicillium rubens]KAJ5044734.1 hypothetical protein NUH16_001540 [Penicillium rubens]KAJ5839297.1 hypothetical protein N7525_004485 [Penicillium rubens]KAJ5867349.1 hypothetical protein N7534_001902 [Penicillium rubens]